MSKRKKHESIINELLEVLSSHDLSVKEAKAILINTQRTMENETIVNRKKSNPEG